MSPSRVKIVWIIGLSDRVLRGKVTNNEVHLMTKQILVYEGLKDKGGGGGGHYSQLISLGEKPTIHTLIVAQSLNENHHTPGNITKKG